jgi:glycosyltransferase involved in cell wall biosynthesis
VSGILHISGSRYASIAAAGHTGRIWSALANSDRAHHVLARNVRLRSATDRAGNVVLHLVPGVPSELYALLSYRALAVARRHRPVAILCQDPLLGGLAGVHVGRVLGIPVMVELHTDVHFANLAGRAPAARAAGLIARHALRRADRVRIVSPTFAGALEATGVGPRRIVQLPSRVDTALFAPDEARRARGRAALGAGEDTAVVLSIGRFVAQKGHLEMIRAFARLRDELPHARLVLVGGGPLEESYRAAARGLGEAVNVLGWTGQDTISDLLAAADVYAQPSLPDLGEAMPRTILEAMASGLPIVATAVAGIPGVVEDGRNGLLVPARDADALSAAIVRLAEDGALRARLGAQARRDAEERYEWHAHFARYRSEIAAMVAEGPRR